MGLSAASSGQPPEELLDFEELQPKCVGSVTRGDWGTGPVRISGTSHRFGNTNVAVVVDTEHPDADPDLTTGGFHNALIISKIRPKPPEADEAAWSEGWVPSIDDDNVPGGLLSFDFERTGPVTFYGLTLLDHDDSTATIRIYREAGAGELFDSLPPEAHLEMRYGRKSWWRDWLRPQKRRARFNPPDAERPFYRLQVAPIGASGRATRIDLRQLRPRGRATRSLIGSEPPFTAGISDVTKIEVKLGGSSAVDKVAFRPQGTGETEQDDLFTRIQGYLTVHIAPELVPLEQKYTSRWQELRDNPPPTVRSDLERLLAELERELLGGPGAPDTTEPRSPGLLECPKLHCGCPQLRPLRAWVNSRIAAMRAQVAAATDEELLRPAATAARGGVRIAGLEPAAYLAAAQDGGRIALAQMGGGSGCDEDASFWTQFFCRGDELFDGAKVKVASLFGRVLLPADSMVIAGETQACESYKLTPMLAEFRHVEVHVRPGEPKKIEHGAYCVFCRTADGQDHPKWRLDDLDDRLPPGPCAPEADS